MTAGPLLCHVSVPKTATNSVEGYLRAVLGDGHRAWRLPGRPLDRQRPRACGTASESVQATLFDIRSREDRLSAFSLNLPVGVDAYLRRPVDYLVVLREPVDRCLSVWHFAARTRDRNPMWAAMADLDHDVERVLARPWSYPLRNEQTRYLAGCTDQEITARHFDRAARTLAGSLCGTVGALDRLAVALGRRLDRPVLPVPRENVTPRDAVAEPPGMTDALRAANHWDARLHDLALELGG